jgi:hypothetical protein
MIYSKRDYCFDANQYVMTFSRDRNATQQTIVLLVLTILRSHKFSYYLHFDNFKRR